MLWPHPYLDTMVVLGVVVGQSGTRFVDEGRGGVYVANQLARRDDPLDAIVVFDDAVWQGPAKDIGAPPTPNPSLERAGATIHTAGTIAELAQAAGIDGARLTRTVEEFNKAAAGGTLGALAPARTTSRFMPAPIAKPPFRAIPMCAGITYTMGGPEIDSATRVLNGDGHPIEGLHAIGSATGGVEGGPHSGYVGGLGKAFILGYRAAEVIAGKVPA
jgi:fumarate reductase flavoprotein subunit